MQRVIDTRSVRVGGAITFPRGAVLNAIQMWEWLLQQEKIVGWTYSVNLNVLLHLHNVKVIAACYSPAHHPLPTTIKICNNNHAKCYIGERRMLIGSLNLTFPTIEDLGVLISDKATVNMFRVLFREQWKQL